MTKFSERHLAEFVNRSDEIDMFCHIIESGETPIMVVSGDGGVGKSSLLERMIHECAIRKLRRAEIVWTDTRNHNYLETMRKIRDAISGEFFNKFTNLVNYFMDPKYELNIKIENANSISVAEGARIEGSSVGDIAAVIIKDCMITIPRTDMAVPESERLARLTDCFMEDFGTALRTGPILVVFFDAVEKMSQDTHNWVWGEMLRGVQDGRLRNVRFILCGRVRPPLDLHRDMKMCVKTVELKPLEHEHIVDYLARRGIAEDQREALAKMLIVAAKGNPLQIANLVDSFLEMDQG
jgi:hypothetical protein